MLIGVVGWVGLGTILGFIASKVISLGGDDPRIGMERRHRRRALQPFQRKPSELFQRDGSFFAAIAAVVALTEWHCWRWKSAT